MLGDVGREAVAGILDHAAPDGVEEHAEVSSEVMGEAQLAEESEVDIS